MSSDPGNDVHSMSHHGRRMGSSVTIPRGLGTDTCKLQNKQTRICLCLSDHPGFHCNMLQPHVEARAFPFHLHLNILIEKLPGHQLSMALCSQKALLVEHQYMFLVMA